MNDMTVDVMMDVEGVSAATRLLRTRQLTLLQLAIKSPPAAILARDSRYESWRAATFTLSQLLAVTGARYAALFTHAPGQPLDQQCTPPNARAFGNALAQVHTLTEGPGREPRWWGVGPIRRRDIISRANSGWS